MRLTPDELQQVADQVVEILSGSANRNVPDDGRQREPVFVFARGFPAQP